jgi:predicted AlkP superfamily phosphohydrolase/phosphomutase/tetratricopeptide (TPR) repeat protein
MNNAQRKRIVLIGWDGADWQHISPLIDEGLMPCLEGLINRGVMGNLATLQPVLSPMLWNSIATGKTADKHGICGFAEPFPDYSGVRPSTSTSRKTKAIWNIFNQHGLRSNVVGWWASFPAEPINGYVVSNLFNGIKRDADGKAIIGPHIIGPAAASEELGDLKVDISEITVNDIGPFCPEYTKVDQDDDKRLATLAKLLADCASIQSVTTHLMEKPDWDFTAVYFDSIDHFCHAFMPYHPPKMPNISDKDFSIYKDVIRGAYQFHDMMLQRQLQLAGEDATIILCSDHGFQSGAGRPLVTPMEPAGPALWHRSHGVVVMAGPGIKKDERVYGANIIDITPTILHAAGLPIGEDMDGRVLLDAFESSEQPKMIESWDLVEGDSGKHPEGYDVFVPGKDDDKQDDLIKQFVALGYIEDPGDDKAQAAENADIELKYNLARVFYSTDRNEEALPMFVDLVRRVPWEDRFWKNLSYCCYETHRYGQARDIIEELYQDADRIPPFSKLILAQCAWEFGEREKAQNYVDQLLAGRLRVANVYHSLGQLLVSKIRDLDKAEKAFQKCTKVDPDYAFAYQGLAGVYLRKKQYQESVDAALTAVTKMYRLPKAHFYLGLALEKLGEKENAILALNRVCDFNNRKFKLLAQKRLIKILDSSGRTLDADPIRVQYKLTRSAARSRKPNVRDERFELPPIPPAEERKLINDARRKTKSQKDADAKTFLLVSGLPRSGTSLMMQMLQAGGIAAQTDGLRKADENNSKGYFEWEAIKNIGKEPELLDAEGVSDKAIKVISMLLPLLPSGHKYKVIFMMRPVSEVAVSQLKMIQRLETEGSNLKLEQLVAELEDHRTKVLGFLESRPQIEVLKIDYLALLDEPLPEIEKINKFVRDDRLDPKAMPSVIDVELHRERSKNSG